MIPLSPLKDPMGRSPKARGFRSLTARSQRNASGAGIRRSAFAVQPFAHFLARLEERNALLVDRHMRAGTRIAPRAGRTVLDREGAETAQLDPVAARQRRHDLV